MSEHDALPDAPSEASNGRRDFLTKAGIGTAAAWIAPVVLSSPAHAQGTPPVVVDPFFVAGSEATAFTGPAISDKSITLTSNNVLAGDLWIAILSYSEQGTLVAPVGAGWNVSPVVSGGTGIYSVESLVVWRILTPGDLSGTTFSQAFAANGADLTYGGFRGAGVAYRGSNLTAAVNPSGVTQGAGTGSTATATFPTAAPAGVAPNTVVRLGSGRGYGGYTSINWTAIPHTTRVSFNSGNSGDRAIAISDIDDNTGAAVNGTIDVGLFGARHRTTFTAVIRNV